MFDKVSNKSIFKKIKNLISNNKLIERMKKKSFLVCDGLGFDRISKKVF